MKPWITAPFAAAALCAASSVTLAADSITVTGAQPARTVSRDAAATNACFTAFISALIPGNTARVRTVIPADGVQVFRSGDGSVFAAYKKMDVEMTATAASNGQLLARSQCKVNRDAKVLELSTQVTHAARLAGLSVHDIKLAMLN